MDYLLRSVQLGLARTSSCFLLPGLAKVSTCCLPGLAEVRLIQVKFFWARGKYNGSRRSHVTAYRAVRDALAILVVTRLTRDHVKSVMRVMHQCVPLLFVLNREYFG